MDRVQDGERITITSKNRNAVLMSEEEYDSLVETLHLLSDPDMAADLGRTRRTPLSEMEVWDCPDTPRSRKCRHAEAARGRKGCGRRAGEVLGRP